MQDKRDDRGHGRSVSAGETMAVSSWEGKDRRVKLNWTLRLLCWDTASCVLLLYSLVCPTDTQHCDTPSAA